MHQHKWHQHHQHHHHQHPTPFKTPDSPLGRQRHGKENEKKKTKKQKNKPNQFTTSLGVWGA
eukprot:11630516-Karenia_brevis.AAC.1